jgi:hypothetical protein
METDLKHMMEYELVLSSYLYHALTTFALRDIISSVTVNVKAILAKREGSTWPPFSTVLGGINLVNRREKIWHWMLVQVSNGGDAMAETNPLATLQPKTPPRQTPESTANSLTSTETLITLVDPRSPVSNHILDQLEPEDEGILVKGKRPASHLADFLGMEDTITSADPSSSSSLIDLRDLPSEAKASDDAVTTPSSLEGIIDLDPLIDEDRGTDTASDLTISRNIVAVDLGAQTLFQPVENHNSPPTYSSQLQVLDSKQVIQQPLQHAANANVVEWTPPMALTHALVALPIYLAPVPVRPVWPTFVEKPQTEFSASFRKPQTEAAIIERPRAELSARFRESQRAATSIEKPPAELSMRFKALQKENQKPLNAKASAYVSTASNSAGNDSLAWW